MRNRNRLGIVLVLLVIVAALAYLALRSEPQAPTPSVAKETPAAPSKPAAQEPPAPQVETASAAATTQSNGGERDGGGDVVADVMAQIGLLDRDSERAFRWSQVDLDTLRAELPDNAFWTLGAPTNDPRVLEERRERDDAMNEAWGRVLSGNATEDDIHDYYAERHRVSSDYVAFTDLLLERHGDVLPDSDKGLLEVSRKMHRARLQQMPRKLMEALERKGKQDRLREAWLADEAAFESALERGDDPIEAVDAAMQEREDDAAHQGGPEN